MVETRYAAVVDSYIDMGAFYDRAALAPLRREIISAADAAGADYGGVSRCLRAARTVSEQARTLVLTDGAVTKLEKRAAGVAAREFGGRGKRAGRLTKRFLSGVTPQGALCFYDTVQSGYERIYQLDSAFGLEDMFLKKLLSGAMAAGRSVIVCPDPMDPERAVSHLLVPELSLAFVSGGGLTQYEGRAFRRLRLDGALEKSRLAADRARVRFMHKTARALTQEAVSLLSGIKAGHDALEALYNPHVDFAGVHALADKTAEELLSL